MSDGVVYKVRMFCPCRVLYLLDCTSEAWGEDFLLTSHMGVAYASGLSKNGSWSDTDAVIPVMKVSIQRISFFQQLLKISCSILQAMEALAEDTMLLRIMALDFASISWSSFGHSKLW